MNQQIGNIMTQNVATVSESQSIQEAAEIMSSKNVGSLPVVNSSGQVTGMLTDRDITLRTTAEGRDGNTPVSQVMSSQQVVQADPGMDAQQASQIMAEHQIRRLPVVENGQVVGMVALGDLAADSQNDSKAGQALSNISTPSSPKQ
ncbi:CBS domain-containing protein [Virgibacillus ihumii]|uniref:CBS domain-containing protein n=1 Tax=Virgibacillus ihumii TaxID=2686091 RepID=UPI00157E0C30|nr:CBS domain-containing protein [Virgibacillus ihumii]